ncbi:hypothetical protein AYI70_g7264 [Smittium culicis]|uniref:Uncharacterized protein n=1 Tax=Smittium culicis TaxID=133412 RepID=A0A1R1XLG4_9FUNG|nr:hypothetical protein AYI70_g7264 [Smittium culicis]
MIKNPSQSSSKENFFGTNSTYYKAENEEILDNNDMSSDLADQVTPEKIINYAQVTLSTQQSFRSDDIEIGTNLFHSDAINVALFDYQKSNEYKHGKDMYNYDSSKYLDDSESASSYNSSNSDEYYKVSRVVGGYSLNGGDSGSDLVGNSGALHRIKKYSNLTRDFFREKADTITIGENIADRIKSMVISPSSSSQATEECQKQLGNNLNFDEFETSSLKSVSKKSSDASYILITPVRNKRSHDSFERENRSESNTQIHSQEEISQATLVSEIDPKSSSISFDFI